MGSEWTSCRRCVLTTDTDGRHVSGKGLAFTSSSPHCVAWILFMVMDENLCRCRIAGARLPGDCAEEAGVKCLCHPWSEHTHES